ncbi:hypothetical protein Bca4012_012560 [Brassica carinata]|uniref:Formin-like protein n=1 Tax=Brassica carinata TaxID=52824 RepID=A0A8X7U3E8_BRACI|nr:hypothetical protein Bca52824_069970 [Brassica carinata]
MSEIENHLHINEEFFEAKETDSDCATDGSNHKHDVNGEAPVKDITVDGEQYRSDGKADTNIDSVKDIEIDDGDDEQRKRRTMEAKENDSRTAETEHEADVEGNDSPKYLEPTPLPPLPPPPQFPGVRAPGPPPPPGPSPPGGGPPPPLGLRPPAGGPPNLNGAGTGRGLGLGSSAQKKSSLKPFHWVKVKKPVQGSVWDELPRHGEGQIAPVFDVSEMETLFPATVPKRVDKAILAKPQKVQLIERRRAHNVEILLSGVKMPLHVMMAAVLKMDDTILDIDQIEKLIKICPTKDEMKLVKNYSGDKTNLGKCEQHFLELMKVPRVESKLKVFNIKIQFHTQVKEFKKSLTAVNSACEEVCTSQKLKEILKWILGLGNTLNQGTLRGAAVAFTLDSLLKLSDTRAANSKMTLMRYLCKVLASKASHLLDFHKDLQSLESASKIKLKSLVEEMKDITEALEMLEQELTASERDGPVSQVFCKTLKDFISIAEAETETVSGLYSVVGQNADGLSYYFSEDPKCYPFEQVSVTLLKFIRLFKKAQEENIKEEELEKKIAEMKKAKGVSLKE